jgi:heme-degrading monooxygenase HmoA
MKTFESTGVKSFAAGLLAVIMLTCSFAATAGPAVAANEQVSIMGFQWVKYLINTKTFETGSVSLWSSRADVEAFLKSDAYKGIPEKLKPLMKGTMSSEIYEVYEPKK